jgi:ubiquinone/menaquinone biosynthesis C-methylase UbiE
MHSFVHRHLHAGAGPAAETPGRILDLGWRYDLMAWFCDTVLLRGRLRQLRRRTISLARIQPGDTVLDVGAGTGTLALEVQPRVGATGKVFGIDPGPQQVARARAKAAQRRRPVTFQMGVIEQLNFPDQSFDVVLSTIMFHHLPGDLKRQGLAEIARVLKPEGRLVIADFQRPYAGQQPSAHIGASENGMQPLTGLVTAAGFSQVEVETMHLPRRPGLPSLFSHGVGFISAHKSDDARVAKEAT